MTMSTTPAWLLQSEVGLCPCGCIGKRKKADFIEKTIGGRAGIERRGSGGKTAVFTGRASWTISGWASWAIGTLNCGRARGTVAGGTNLGAGGTNVGRTSAVTGAMTGEGASCVPAGRAISGKCGRGMVRMTCWQASENARMKNGASRISRDRRSSRV